jgi:hypothetical protein
VEQREIKGRPGLTAGRQRSCLAVAARRSRLGQHGGEVWLGFWVGKCRGGEGFMGVTAWTRGKGLIPNRRGFGGDFPGAPVFVPDTSGGMTGGPLCQRRERE